MKGLVLTCLLAGVLVGCSANTSGRTTFYEGMHLQVDAEVSITPKENQLLITHQLFAYNGGTQTCREAHVSISWPKEWENRVTGRYTGLAGPFPPGSQGVDSGNWEVDVAGLDWRGQYPSVALSVRCADPKSDPVTITPRFVVNAL